ncbi:hypothetical protein OUZ56_010380 [Daphnia magna]|uniref:Uncharacterized protein n=1 Tax=Daphnia magna TaxID=35525 RepID=A0ABR0AID5_9CRUS|nr:hypothetical protein OUZ56_010380 [Daphnia magna]
MDKLWAQQLEIDPVVLGTEECPTEVTKFLDNYPVQSKAMISPILKTTFRIRTYKHNQSSRCLSLFLLIQSTYLMCTAENTDGNEEGFL